MLTVEKDSWNNYFSFGAYLCKGDLTALTLCCRVWAATVYDRRIEGTGPLGG